jgi:ribosomal RNA-processing protein 8
MHTKLYYDLYFKCVNVLIYVILHHSGLLKIADVESRFQYVRSFIQKLVKFGFVNTWEDLSHNLFYFMDFKKEKCISKKMKKKSPELILKPCLYKKR